MDELPQVAVTTDFTGPGIVDDNPAGPDRFEDVGVALFERGQIVTDRVSLTGGTSLHPSELHGGDEVGEPGHRCHYRAPGGGRRWDAVSGPQLSSPANSPEHAVVPC